MLFASETPSALDSLLQHLLIGLTNGSLIALIALGYSMVYGIIGLINFAHGDLFMLGCFLAFSIVTGLGLEAGANAGATVGVVLLLLLVVPVFCGLLNVGVDQFVYRPLRNAPKLAPLVSAIGVSFIFMNIGQFWGGATDRHFPKLLPNTYLIVLLSTVPIMVALTIFVQYSKLGKAMRATQQDPLAARLMGINVDGVIRLTFGIGGALGGAASVIYALHINTVNFQMGFQNGLYAFTAAVLGGIGNIPGAVLGGLIIGLTRSLGSAYIGESWTSPLIFGILIVILVFRPEGLLGSRTKEKV